jgi:hypothetical protein
MAAIAHAETLETTDQSHTGDTNWTTKATLASGSFVAGGKYLILCLAQIGGSSPSDTFGFRLAHGETPAAFTGAETTIEPAAQDDRHGYGYFTVFTQPGGGAEDVIFQIKTLNSTRTAYADTIHIVAIRLDADLTENTDWFYNEDDDSGAPTEHTTTFAPFASITFTPDNADDDWLILANPSYLGDAVNVQVEYRVNRDSDTEVAPLFSQEGEDTSEALTWLMHRVFTLTAASHTFAVEGRDDATGITDHHSSRVFALRLNAFKDYDFVWNEAEFTPTATHTSFDEIAAIDITPSTAADFLILGYMSFDAAVAGYQGYLRVQKGGTTTPTGSDTALNSRARAYDSDDENPCATMALENLGTSAQDLDLDATTDITTTPRYEDRSFVALSMELAAGAAPTTRRYSLTVTGVG